MEQLERHVKALYRVLEEHTGEQNRLQVLVVPSKKMGGAEFREAWNTLVAPLENNQEASGIVAG
eukprot:12407197-Prorocentrum_lima.AAC.1